VNLASDIKELILLNEGVILPGLGGFFTTYRPAEMQKDSNVFQPPSVKVDFDSQMIKDNGLLVSRIAQKNNFTEEEARLKVNEYINELKKELREKGSVTLEDVGTISANPEGDLTFVGAADKNYYLQSFGLPAIEITRSVQPSETKTRTIPSPVVPVIAREKKKVPLAALISFLVVLAAGAVYFTGVFDRYLKPLFQKNEPVSMDSLANDNKIVFGQTVPAEEDTLDREVNQQLTEKTSQEKALYYQESGKAEINQTEIKVPESNAQLAAPAVGAPAVIERTDASHRVAPTGKYYIVAGSFLKPGNADRQKAQLEKKGYSPRIVQKNDNFFYVTLQSFDSRETAEAEMSKLAQNLNLPLWVMKK
jgi:CCDC81-like prokaryotic HU domain 2/CCDC81-like prokaryotic HU domain 1/SPOR domain